MNLKASTDKHRLLCQVSLWSTAVLYFIWPLPHTMALRNLLLAIVAVAGIILCLAHAEYKKVVDAPWLYLFIALLGWVVFHATFISSNGAEAWVELFGQWIKAYLAMLGGIGCALASQSIKKPTFKFYFMVTLVAQPVLFLLFSIIESIRQGHFLLLSLTEGFQKGHFVEGYFGLFDHKMSLAFFSHVMVAFACAKLLNVSKPRISIDTLIWFLAVVLGFYIAIVSSSRNSTALLALLCTTMAVMLLYQLRLKIAGFISVGVVIVAMLWAGTYFSLTTNTGWKNLVGDAKVAVNINTHPNWINIKKYGLPKNEKGDEVSESNYLRIAYGVAGFEKILQHPLGYGVTRHALERLVQIDHPDAKITSSHNGYFDLVLAVGLPALILLVMGVYSVLKQLRNSKSEWAIPATWIIGTIMLHWMIDPVSRDHYFEAFLFIIGLFATLASIHEPEIQTAPI